MPRKRQIDPSIWTSEQFINLHDPWARLLFIGIFSNADDEGRMKASPAYLKTVIFPGDSFTTEMIEQWRAIVAEEGLIQVYNLDGTEYLHLPTWYKHQYISKPYPSKHPPPPSIPSPLPNHSVNAPALQHTIGNGIDESRNGTGSGTDRSATATGKGKERSDIEERKSIVFGEFCKIYEQNVGILTPMIGQELDTLATRIPLEWFQEAVKEAVSLNKRNLKYIIAIIKRWEVEGFKSPMKKQRRSATEDKQTPGEPVKVEGLEIES